MLRIKSSKSFHRKCSINLSYYSCNTLKLFPGIKHDLGPEIKKKKKEIRCIFCMWSTLADSLAHMVIPLSTRLRRCPDHRLRSRIFRALQWCGSTVKNEVCSFFSAPYKQSLRIFKSLICKRKQFCFGITYSLEGNYSIQLTPK